MTTNRRITLAQTPTDKLAASDFADDEIATPELEDGQFLLDVKYVSVDPTIRGWVAYDTYLPKIAEGEVIRAGGAGEVIESRNTQYPVGTRVTGMTGWQSLAVSDGGFIIPDGVDYTDALSVFGATGLTAYVGMLNIGKPAEGETVVVSGAAGAVGSLAGQIAKIKGATVIGLAGSPEKCAWVTEELGFDQCLNYREGHIARQLHQACPKGIDVYFDNVGGETLNAVLGQIRDKARIVMCGSISNYDGKELQPGPANIVNVVPRRALLQGFIVLDHFDQAREASQALSGWMMAGQLKSRVDVTQGLENAPTVLLGLFTGANIGKALVAV
ncbi:MAG: NADP-dependent oxidoreductase [Micrococcales bacterium]|nr:NADP-dependent oxidoreductase [Micrococcales bacterium]